MIHDFEGFVQQIRMTLSWGLREMPGKWANGNGIELMFEQYAGQMGKTAGEQRGEFEIQG